MLSIPAYIYTLTQLTVYTLAQLIYALIHPNFSDVSVGILFPLLSGNCPLGILSLQEFIHPALGVPDTNRKEKEF